MRNLEYPPILKGTAEEQLEQLREYMLRVVQKLNEESD